MPPTLAAPTTAPLSIDRRARGSLVSVRDHGGRMLITRERTSPITDREISDWIAMSPLTRWVSGMVSVGLNATTLVNARYRWSWNRGCQFAGPSPEVRV